MWSFVGHFYFSVRGRTSRRFYWLFGVIPPFVAGFAFGLGLFAARSHLTPIALFVAIVVGVPLVVWTSVAVLSKRSHDIGVSAWWAIAAWMISLTVGYFVSERVGQLSSLLIWSALGIVPGTRGDNRFGPDPTRSPMRRPDETDAPAA